MLQAINLTNSSSHDVSYLTLLVETYLNKSAEMKIWADAQNIIVMHTWLIWVGEGIYYSLKPSLRISVFDLHSVQQKQ